MSNSLRPSYQTDQSVNTFPWSMIWFNALRRPYVATFEEFIRDPKASSQRALLWVFISTLLGGFIIGLNPYGRFGALPLRTTLIGISLLSIISVAWFVLLTGFAQLTARVLGGTGTYVHLAYAIAAFHAPLTILRGLFLTSPIIGFMFFGYGIWLTAIAIKAVQKISWGKTVLATTSVFICIFIVVGLAVLMIYQILGSNVIYPPLI